MCRPQDLLNRVTIFVDAAGNIAGAGVVHHWSTDHEVVEALDVGPFDTAEQVLGACLRRLPIQTPLWHDLD